MPDRCCHALVAVDAPFVVATDQRNRVIAFAQVRIPDDRTSIVYVELAAHRVSIEWIHLLLPSDRNTREGSIDVGAETDIQTRAQFSNNGGIASSDSRAFKQYPGHPVLARANPTSPPSIMPPS